VTPRPDSSVPTPPISGTETPVPAIGRPRPIGDKPLSRTSRNSGEPGEIPVKKGVTNPVSGDISHPRRPEFVLHSGMVALTPDEVERLLRPIDRLEERCLLELALTTGIRREDLVAITLASLDLERGMVGFYESKKRRDRRVPVQGRTLVDLRTYVRGLPRGSRWLFPSPRKAGAHQTGRFAWTIFNRWLDVAGLPRRPFHATRATAYKLCKARGWSVELSAALLGDTIRVAQEFYGVATPGELLEVAKEKPLL